MYPRTWIDGCSYSVQTRAGSVLTFKNISVTIIMLSTTTELFEECSGNIGESYSRVYIAEDNSILPSLTVVVYSKINHRDSLQFLHLMYSMGEFETELYLFAFGSLRQCSKTCNLSSDRGSIEETGSSSLKHYMFEQPIFLPGGNSAFCARLESAHDAIIAMFRHDDAIVTPYPCVLMKNLVLQTENRIHNHVKNIYQRLSPANVRNIHAQLDGHGNGVWIPDWFQMPCQSSLSFAEQYETLHHLTRNVTNFTLMKKTTTAETSNKTRKTGNRKKPRDFYRDSPCYVEWSQVH